jgi:hypothetical protein
MKAEYWARNASARRLKMVPDCRQRFEYQLLLRSAELELMMWRRKDARMATTHCGTQRRTLTLAEQLARLTTLMTTDGSLEAERACDREKERERERESSGW